MLNRFLVVVVALALIAFGFVWFSGEHATVKLATPVPALGTATSIKIETDDPNGVKSFSASLEQNGHSQTIYQDKTKSKQKSRIYTFTAGKQQAGFLTEGTAKLVVEATSNDFRGHTTTFEQEFPVVLRPPTIVADGRQHYINQGGAELVVLDAGGNWTEAGVRVGKYSAGTFPMPGEPDHSGHRFSLFPFPWDVPADVVPVAFARNAAGTEVTTSFWTKVFPKKFRHSNINVTDREMQKVVGELDPDGTS